MRCGVSDVACVKRPEQPLRSLAAKEDSANFVRHWACGSFSKSCVMPSYLAKVPVVFVAWPMT